MKYFSVDRIENKIAVLEDDDENRINVSLNLLPPEVKETDIVFADASGNYKIDSAETQKRKKDVENLENELFGN